MHICVDMSALCVLMEARGWLWLSSCITPFLVSWDGGLSLNVELHALPKHPPVSAHLIICTRGYRRVMSKHFTYGTISSGPREGYLKEITQGEKVIDRAMFISTLSDNSKNARTLTAPH